MIKLCARCGDGAEICELMGAYFLNWISNKVQPIQLIRGQWIESTQKNAALSRNGWNCIIFVSHGLRITIEADKK